MSQTKVIVIKDEQNQGKTTTMWLLLKALEQDNGIIKNLHDLNNDRPMAMPQTIPSSGFLVDFHAFVEWHGKSIVLNSRGDYVKTIVDDTTWALDELKPDYLICAVRWNSRNNKYWNAFNQVCPNTVYERVCFWSEKTDDAQTNLHAKQATVNAIMKYMN